MSEGGKSTNYVVLYLDDILVFSLTWEDMIERLDNVLSKLGNYGLKLKPSKCAFFQRSTKYLGHVISEEGVALDPDKVRVVKEWSTPTNRVEIRSFIGLASYYRKFVKGFAMIANPLNELLSVEGDFVWSDKCEEAFSILKERLTTAPILGYPDFKEDFILETDACSDGLGAILSQGVGMNSRIIAYASLGLRGAEKDNLNYSSMRLELLALKWALTEKFRNYCLGSKVIAYTDNNPLSRVKESKLNSTDMRWIAQIEQFNLELKYRAGKLNKNADSLSRMVDIKNIKLDINQRLRNQWPEIKGDKLVEIQEGDKSLCRILEAKRVGRIPSNEEVEGWGDWKAKLLVREWKNLRLKAGVLYIRDSRISKSERLVIPESMQGVLMAKLHDEFGHQGRDRTVGLIRERGY